MFKIVRMFVINTPSSETYEETLNRISYWRPVEVIKGCHTNENATIVH